MSKPRFDEEKSWMSWSTHPSFRALLFTQSRLICSGRIARHRRKGLEVLAASRLRLQKNCPMAC